MNKKQVLVIGTVWPEPGSSAAGTRMIQLLQLFLDYGHAITFASAAAESPYSHPLASMGINTLPIKLNDSAFNEILHQLQPDIVIYDRFMIEEQYGWRVRMECPDALTILDTEDLHSLRAARKLSLKSGATALDFSTDIAKREVAAIYRCDLSLMISEQEIEILAGQLKVDRSILYYLPFMEQVPDEAAIADWPGMEAREGFCFIGNYLHEPNWHTLKRLKTEVWPLLRKELPGVHLHIYGAYATERVMQLHQPKDRFLVHGRAEDARQAISRHRLLLAPIAFGAGVKGKLIDTMQTGTPSVTSSIGAESMRGSLPWNGAIEDDVVRFVASAKELYLDQSKWSQAQQHGLRILRERYDATNIGLFFMQHVEQLISHLKAHREQNYVGQLLHHHTANSTKYMSLWIEEKNKPRG